MLRKKPTEKLTRLNRYLFLVTQSPDLLRSITKWESMCSRSSTQLKCASRPWMPSVWELHTFKYGLRESPTAVLYHSTHAYKLSFANGRRAGWPRLVRYDRGAHDRGAFSSILIKNGVTIRPAGLEMPKQIGRVGRRGDTSRKTMSKATKDTHVSGTELKDMIFVGCLPSYRAKACESFVRWDRQRLRPWLDHTKLVAEFCVAENHELVNTHRDGVADQDWSVSRRTKTASVKRNHATPFSSALPLIVYVRVRPQNYWYFTTRKPKVLHLSQQRLRHNEVSSKKHSPLAEPSRTVDDDRDDEMSEPTQTMNAEKRKVNETAKESRAPLPITTSSHTSSSRFDDETHGQFTRSTKQARIKKTRAEAPQDVSFLFLQARMADMRGGNEERMLMKKDDERKLYIAYCPPEMQTVPRETRRVVWETRMSFSAVVILTDEESRQLNW